MMWLQCFANWEDTESSEQVGGGGGESLFYHWASSIEQVA